MKKIKYQIMFDYQQHYNRAKKQGFCPLSQEQFAQLINKIQKDIK